MPTVLLMKMKLRSRTNVGRSWIKNANVTFLYIKNVGFYTLGFSHLRV